MEWVNITAKTLPEAIDLALDNLGVDEAEADIEVLEEPRQGLFGRTRGNARVRARVTPKATRPKVERGRNRRRKNEGNRTSGGDRSGRDGGGRGRDERSSGSDKGSGGDRQGRRDRKKSRDDENAPSADGEKRGGGKATAADGRGGGRDGGRSGGGDKANGDGSPRRERGKKERPKGTSKPGKDRAPVEESSMDEVSTELETFLAGLTEAFGFDGEVSVTEDDGGLLAAVEGRHGLMVGPKGRTLDAIQELARVSAQRSAPSSIRIKVDVGGYRELRREALSGFAHEAAVEAKRDGKERSLEPMNSADRKIIHDALSDVEGVETRSAGNEPRRRVVVVPVGVTADDADDVDDEIDGEVIDGEVVEDQATEAANGDASDALDSADADADADGAADAEDADGSSSDDVDESDDGDASIDESAPIGS